MVTQRTAAWSAKLGLWTFALAMICAGIAVAQQSQPNPHAQNGRQRTSAQIARAPLQYQVTAPSQQLEMVVATSRILTTDYIVPRMQVMNPDIVRVQPLAQDKVLISALKPGITTLNLWDEHDKIYNIDLKIYADGRELEELIQSEFPEADIRVKALQNSVIITGSVPDPETNSRVVSIAKDFFGTVHNNLNVAGVQQILLHVKIMEVSRTKLRALGVDWMNVNLSATNQFGVSRVAGLISDYLTQDDLIVRSGAEAVAFGAVRNGQGFFALIEALRQHNLAKVLAEPTITTVAGRPAMFNSGGDVPVIVPQGLGQFSVEYRSFGTQVDFLPLMLPNGNIRLEVRPAISDVDPSLSVNVGTTSVSGFRSRSVDTAAELKPGQTMAIAGLLQHRIESENKGLPVLADLPWIGPAFRRVEERVNEVELLIMVTPELVAPMDPHQVPPCGPGQLTTQPNDVDFYWKGYTEVPKCCADGSCANCAPPGQPFIDRQSVRTGPAVITNTAPAAVRDDRPVFEPSAPRPPNVPERIPAPVTQPPQAAGPAMNRAPVVNYPPTNTPNAVTVAPVEENRFQTPATSAEPLPGGGYGSISSHGPASFGPGSNDPASSVPASQGFSSTEPAGRSSVRPTANAGRPSNPMRTDGRVPQIQPPVAPQNPQNRQNSVEPGLIGPIGYDRLQ